MEESANVLTPERYNEIWDNLEQIIPGLEPVESVECMNLILRKEFAEEIVSGKKKIEFRNYSEFYCNRLFDKKLMQIFEDYHDNEDVIEACKPFSVHEIIKPIKIIESVRLHNYNNSWSLTVECIDNDLITLTPNNADWMEETFGDTEFREIVKSIEDENLEECPIMFYFALGKIIERKNI